MYRNDLGHRFLATVGLAIMVGSVYLLSIGRQWSTTMGSIILLFTAYATYHHYRYFKVLGAEYLALTNDVCPFDEKTNIKATMAVVGPMMAFPFALPTGMVACLAHIKSSSGSMSDISSAQVLLAFIIMLALVHFWFIPQESEITIESAYDRSNAIFATWATVALACTIIIPLIRMSQFWAFLGDLFV